MFKNGKLSIPDLMCQWGEGGTVYSKLFFTIQLSELTFKPRKRDLPPSSGEKIVIITGKSDILGLKTQNSKTPNSKILLTQRNDLYRRVSLVDFYQNPSRKVHIIFWNETHPLSWKFGVCRSYYYGI